MQQPATTPLLSQLPGGCTPAAAEPLVQFVDVLSQNNRHFFFPLSLSAVPVPLISNELQPPTRPSALRHHHQVPNPTHSISSSSLRAKRRILSDSIIRSRMQLCGSRTGAAARPVQSKKHVRTYIRVRTVRCEASAASQSKVETVELGKSGESERWGAQPL